jgi:tRNA pseudouridine38-40 synthase
MIDLVNIKLTVAYDGTLYLGWQKTNTGPSIEEALQDVLERILQGNITLQAASRTDAGVHAKGQIVNFTTEKKDLDLQRLKISINSLLPKDIVVLAIEEVAEDFHPTLHCIQKEYHYHLCYDAVQLPGHRLYSWHFPRPLNVQIMREVAQKMVGEHDFSAFCNMRKNLCYENYIRHIYSLEIDELPEKRLRFRIVGNKFLYKMVRNLVGTLAYIGCGKIEPSAIESIFAGHDRTQAGITAPANGLCLYEAKTKNEV